MTQSSPVRILFIHNLLTSFVEIDLHLLRQQYQVTDCLVSPQKLASLTTIPKLVRQHDLIFGWFASAHTLWPLVWARVWGKPSVLVVGGYDVANMPEIGYGNQRGGLRRHMSAGAMKLARKLYPFSKYSLGELENNIGEFPNAEVAYLGVPDIVGALPEKKDDKLILSVGNVDKVNLFRKGHEPFVRAAAKLPDYQFVLVGQWKDEAIDHLRRIAGSNVTFTGRVDKETLLDYYRRTAVYVQASQHEGFGLSVAEAMLAGCVPVVTRAGALPEVVGRCGVFAKSASPTAVAQAIQKALRMPPSTRQEARRHILEQFPLSRRAEFLHRAVHQLLPHTQRHQTVSSSTQ